MILVNVCCPLPPPPAIQNIVLSFIGHASEDDLEPTTGSLDLVQIQPATDAQQSSQDLGSVSEGSAESISGESPVDEQEQQEDAMGSASLIEIVCYVHLFILPVFHFVVEVESGVAANPKPDDIPRDKYDKDFREKLNNLNLVMLRSFIDHFHRLTATTGLQAIPFMQVHNIMMF